jgi:hypothetical protein
LNEFAQETERESIEGLNEELEARSKELELIESLNVEYEARSKES